MKKINEMTEQEILNLTSEEVDKMIKFRMAEEGVIFTTYPEKPIYHEVIKPTAKAYYCQLFGTKISFIDMDELTKVLNAISECKTICTIDSNYELPEGYRNYIKGKVENCSYSNEPFDTISSITPYTHKEYIEIKDKLSENSKNKKAFETSVKEYEAAVNDAKWIKDEILNVINEVQEKYDKLNNFIYKFKNEYLPLAENNEEVAMKFLNKAYSLTEEQQEYVLENYTA